MKFSYLMSFLLIGSLAFGQMRTVTIEKTNIPKTELWSNPQFSPSGKEIYLTNTNYNGIWQFFLENNLLKEITTDVQSGFGFTISEDGNKIAYRRTVQQRDHITRRQESVELSVRSLEKTIVEQGNSVSIPVFSHQNTITSKSISKLSSTALPMILGIEDAKIEIVIGGKKSIFDPLHGQYIWPVLSPDRKWIVAVDMDRGAFVASLDGANVQMIGKCNAPVWTNDGKWIIGMDDKDDGHIILSSDIIAVSPDGKQRYNLTESFSKMAMFPSVSSRENKIVFNTPDGEIYLLTYEEVK